MATVKSPLPLATPLLTVFLLSASSYAHAQSAEPQEPQPEPTQEPTEPARDTPVPAPPRLNPVPAEPRTPAPTAPPEVAPLAEEPTPEMSEGRMLVSLYNSGFQWGISPGVVFSRGKAGFALGLRFGYGFDTGPVILVPGVRLAAYFVEPNVYLGMPTFKVVLPIDRFAPFVEAGAGGGYVSEDGAVASKAGMALMGGGGFMIHFTRIAFGAEASYQVITGTKFKGFGVGPILAIGF
jgi:hypothetical protein